MPSTSVPQRQMMAIAEHHPEQLYKRNRGVLKMSHQQLHDFASTKGLAEGGDVESPRPYITDEDYQRDTAPGRARMAQQIEPIAHQPRRPTVEVPNRDVQGYQGGGCVGADHPYARGYRKL
jgi:hypothetical protein